MRRPTLTKLLLLSLLALAACQPAAEVAEPDSTTVTLLFTNDVESAYDPIPAFWLDDIDMIGGIAEMTTLIETIRALRAERLPVRFGRHLHRRPGQADRGHGSRSSS